MQEDENSKKKHNLISHTIQAKITAILRLDWVWASLMLWQYYS